MVDSNRVMSWAKISRRQLDHWVDKEFIKPMVIPAERMGGKLYDWSMAEAAVVRKMGQLTAAGIPPAIAAKVARGDRKRIEMLLGALAGCVTSLRWELPPTEVGPAPPEGLIDSEPCG
jgi:hypothetical protein